MEMNAKEMVDLLSEDNFVTDKFTTKQSTLKKDANSILDSLVKSMQNGITAGEIKSCELKIEDLDATVYLQNNIINLPFRYAKNIGKIIKDSDNLEMSVYMIIESDDVNRSKLRIDKLADDKTFLERDFTADFVSWLKIQLDAIESNKKEKKEKEDSK